MIRKLLKIIRITITIILCIIGLVFVALYLSGYELQLANKEININWEAIDTIANVIAAIATFAAVFVALYQDKTRLIVCFNIAQSSLYTDKLNKTTLVVSNISNKNVVIRYIQFYFKNILAFGIDTLTENNYCEIEKINNEEIVYIKPIIINPNNTSNIEFNSTRLFYWFGHAIDCPDEKNSHYNMKIILTDTIGEKYVQYPNITFRQYYESLVKLVEGEDIRTDS